MIIIAQQLIIFPSIFCTQAGRDIFLATIPPTLLMGAVDLAAALVGLRDWKRAAA